MFDNSSKPKLILDKSAADENWQAKGRRPGRRSGYLWAACGVLALGIVGALWYTVPILKRHDTMLARSAGLKPSIEALGGRVEQQNAKFAESSTSLEQLRQQIADLRREMRSRLATVKKQAGQSAEELFEGLQKEVNGEFYAINSKVARLELSRDADQVQIADLQNELTQLRQQMAQQTEQFSNRLAEDRSGAEQKIAVVAAAQERERNDLDGLNRKLAVRRIDFEVDKGRNVELAPGISLEISGTDVAYRRVSGWMWVLPDRRTIWLREQGAQEPVVFYGNHDGKKRELVITSVTNKSAVGYLLVPTEEEKAETASVTAQPGASE